MNRVWVLAAGAGVVALLAGGAAYLATKYYYSNLLDQARPVFVQQSQFKLVHPLIGIALPGDQFDSAFPDVRSAIASAIAAEPKGAVTRYAFYLRDLDSGNWTGVNEDDKFDPASLLKVVVAIAAYRQGENQPGFLASSLTYTPALAQINAQLPFALPASLQVGQSYPVPFLIKKELADSDNAAVYTLLSAIDDSTLNEIYHELSIPPPNATSSLGYTLTAREYSRFFRILYNGTLNLDWSHAEQILEDLAESTYTSGLVAGVSSSTIPIAHKYGEHVNGSSGVATSVELSDCGIVYYPAKPYFLCVMVEGKDDSSAASVIAQISRLVYQKISSN